MDNTEYYERSVRLHALNKGKLEVASKVPIENQDNISTACLPGVAGPCMLIAQDPENARRYTLKANTVAVVSDGSSVPGLGNIGGLASLPMIEGKAVLFKKFGNVDAFPICLDTQDADEIIDTIKKIAPGFGGICLESISAPGCFDIEKRLKAELGIPVFHDNQHGSAVVIGAAAINAFRFLGKPHYEIRAVVCGTGVVGNAITKMLVQLGIRDIIILDSNGIISPSRISEFGEEKIELLEMTNKDGISGGLEKAVWNRDLFIGVSKQGVLTGEMVKSMRRNPVIFALANPEPEIKPELAKSAGARIVLTARPDSPSRISNALAFPGIFRGVLDIGAKDITEKMKIAAVHALAGFIPKEKLSEEYLLPSVFEEGVSEAVAKAVAGAWR